MRKYVMSIAGFDPCGGAGVLADIKTFEAIDVQGLGICTGITYQNENECTGIDWVRPSQIIRQLEILLKQYPVHFFKIGLIEHFDLIKDIVSRVKANDDQAYVCWDPVLRSSSGYAFHNVDDIHMANYQVDLIIPNLEEIKVFGYGTSEEIARAISEHVAVILKGGHSTEHADDMLFESDSVSVLKGHKIEGIQKHGSGCVFSSAVTGYLSLGYSLQTASIKAKHFTKQFLQSQQGLLGQFNFEP